MIQAWHFVSDTLRDGSPIPADGKWLTVKSPIIICERGLHASREPFDALQYAPGATLCLVDCDGVVIEEADKLVCSRRRIVARMDATDMLRYFARMTALSVVHLWDTPDVVLDYLMTGDEAIRAAARAAARGAARGAARAATLAATWDATWAATWDATWAAARDAARDEQRRDFNTLVYECFEAFL
jgi:hypothetical protein